MSHPVSFKPEIDSHRIEDLRKRLDHACDYAIRYPEPSSPFEMEKSHFGMTHARHKRLLFAWKEFLSEDSPSNAKGRKRMGADHDTWKAFEKHLNEFEHFKIKVEDLDIHFIHEKASRHHGRPIIPLLLLHGWPSSVHDFFSVIKPLAHPGPSAPLEVPAFDIVVPSQAGYLWSSSPKVDAFGYGQHSGPQGDLLVSDEARINHKIMLALGYKRYAVQGGDLGAAIARHMARLYPQHVAAIHLNFCPAPPPAADPPILRALPSFIRNWAWRVSPRTIQDLWLFLIAFPSWRDQSAYLREPTFASALAHATLGLPPPLNSQDRAKVRRSTTFQASGSAYAFEHGTRPSTIGLVLESGPGALLAWVGEKLSEWTDDDPSDADVCALLTLWWCTDTMSRSIYLYRNRNSKAGPSGPTGDPALNIKQPWGFSDFPYELWPAPLSWMKRTGNLCWYRQHTEGGHFVALERPMLFIEDMRDCFSQIYNE